MQVNIDQVCQGIYEHIPGEDVVGCVRRGDAVLAWAIDGATTLTEHPFTTFPDLTDAGWFARGMGRWLAERGALESFSPSLLEEGLRVLRDEYLRAGGEAQPLHAWPVAAAVVAEISPSGPALRMRVHRYEDCFLEIHSAPASPRSMVPAVLPTQSHDEWKPHSGFGLPALERMWERRRQQQANTGGTALTLNPISAHNAVIEELVLTAPVHVVLGSDGLSRVWDTYNLMSREQALALVAERGLAALLATLREHEASTRTGDAGLKRRDDASGLHLFLG
ncbi:hypothetical protein [Pseudoxanthomonas sp. z9]|uniref:hypothetical protein n=1 Tax=Pseudoxanthomonas sp. z9 TaxID=2584942 RepID=UPI00114163DE|nr:hypothetical protein [Pseudoxanthomonas sp. z9]